jgi:hypothetical protein
LLPAYTISTICGNTNPEDSNVPRHSRIPRLAALLLVFATACGDSVTDPGDPENGTMTATVDGASWSAIQIQGVSSGTLISLAGSDADLVSIGFAVQSTGPGTYSIGPGQVTSANIGEGSATLWTAGSIQGSGTVTLTTVTDNRAIGTFEFVAELAQGSGTPTRTVTNGTFDVTF